MNNIPTGVNFNGIVDEGYGFFDVDTDSTYTEVSNYYNYATIPESSNTVGFGYKGLLTSSSGLSTSAGDAFFEHFIKGNAEGETGD
jgi:hypothetical protein